MSKANITRNVDMTVSLSLSPEQLLKADNMEQLMTAVGKATEKDFKDHPSKDGTGLTDVEIKIEFNGYKTADFEKDLKAEDVKRMSEAELEDVIGEVTVTASAVDNGIEHEGYKSYDWYTPDEPAYVEGLETDDISSEIMTSVEKAFEQFGIESVDYEVDDLSVPEWEDVMADREETARERAEEMAFERYRESLYDD